MVGTAFSVFVLVVFLLVGVVLAVALGWGRRNDTQREIREEEEREEGPDGSP